MESPQPNVSFRLSEVCKKYELRKQQRQKGPDTSVELLSQKSQEPLRREIKTPLT